ncbi:MAG: aminotransferase class I/II-fold pyridoxal phosphate-dependent enzyme, partial [Oscillospiraceae bacterium]|nr:aminotransferase class I/II-fold pyridoxal phosphate-dependent enzyme [Oscillospiraceae bacterium]
IKIMEKITTHIWDFLEQYSHSGTVRGHMPGHKGRDVFRKGLERLFKYDVTEIKGADALFEAEGIIDQSEKNVSRLFGTAATFYSAGGSTLCIQAMLAAVCKKSSAFICGRNAHRAVMNSCVLLGLEPCWVYPEYEENSAVSGEITPKAVRTAIEKYAEKKPACVFITSPDYLGKIADIKGISEVCREHDIPLIVDNAHGAYLAFLEKSRHPIHMGADMCCDSAHKTLPVLTGGAYLHIGEGLCSGLIPVIKRCMALFGSSSPSYLIMASMDLCNKYLSEGFRDDLLRTVKKISDLKKQLGSVYTFYGDEPLKMTIYAFPCGLTGYGLAEQLREGGVEPEYADLTHVVIMFSTASTDEDFERVLRAMQSVRMPRRLLEP